MAASSAETGSNEEPLPSNCVASSVSMVPPELLIEIYAYCIINDPLAPLVLREVCKWWHEIVDTSPRLWQIIPLNEAYGVALPEQQATLWTTRSQPLKYDIVMKATDPHTILPLLSPLLPSVNRWRSFRLGEGRDDQLLSSTLNLTPDNLTHLHLCQPDNDLDEWDDDGPKITFSPISPNDLHSYAMNLWIAEIPSRRLLLPLHFAHVAMADIHTLPVNILEFLTACPELESFYFSGYPSDEPAYEACPVIHLPNLITLHIRNTCFARALLSSLDTPRLKNLYLSHLNVDFYHRGEPDEDGDSDDEAHDFSQSPWSDQATGMGLRNLIKRCNPPIHVLEMDFSDMRTKDFRYVFDRLSELNDFHIVASDMSDKVINLLRPYPSPYHTSLAIRLPSLRKLKLTNCQQLSGTNIADSLSERVVWADSKCPDQTLREVWISGCEGFSIGDRFRLSIILGDRLRP